MRRLLRFVLLVLVLLLVMMASALTAMRFAIHGREVKVPRLVKMNVQEAESAANALGLILLVENKYYSAEIPEGRIIAQFPSEGSQVRRGWRVRVTQSLGAQRSDIPNLVGQSARAAEINVSRRGLELASVAVAKIDGAEPGQIVGQSPPAHASGVLSPKISLLVAAPEADQVFIMPNFVGKHLADVVPKLEDAGMKLGNLTDSPAVQPPGVGTQESARHESSIITKQTPAPGKKISLGETVSFEISP